MDQITVFTDTNGFIQLRDLKDIPWRELFPKAKLIAVMVARPVIDELDDHKVSTNARRRDRARAALRLIDEASAAPERTIELRKAPIRVTLTVARKTRPDWDSLPDLDPAVSDDQLVAAAFMHGHGAVLLSHDSGPRITARDVGLTAFQPPESWLLPAEQSDLQRKVGQLERQLQQALENRPMLEIEVDAGEDAPLILHRPLLERLSPETVRSVSQLYLHGFNRAQISASPDHFIAITGGYTSDDVTNYHSAYDGFEAAVHAFFSTLHETLPAYYHSPPLPFRLLNKGNASATHLHVRLEASGGFGLIAEAKDAADMLSIPTPPKRPDKRDPFDTASLYRHALAFPDIKEDPHPTKMNWINRPQFGAAFGDYGCADFRPGRVFEDQIHLWVKRSLPATGLLKITAGAQSHPDVIRTLEIEIRDQPMAWGSPGILDALPHFVRGELAAE